MPFLCSAWLMTCRGGVFTADSFTTSILLQGSGSGKTSSVAGHEALTESLISLTNLLLRHILGKCDGKNGEGESEVVGWMLLGCKYLDKVMRQLEHAKVKIPAPASLLEHAACPLPKHMLSCLVSNQRI